MNTGEVKPLISEGFENAPLTIQPAIYLADTDEMIWWSERTGWGHYYLYTREGKLKNAITAGPYRALRIAEFDPKNRRLYFTANGREAGENPNYQHLYSVQFDGTGLALMDPGDATHRSSLSPSRQFAVDNASRIDKVPTVTLRRSDGTPSCRWRSADLSHLTATGWKMPETFVVKAADGVTDLYGNLWKPFDFDPSRRYPIIVHVYPGPQQEGTTHDFAPMAGEQTLAQVGFIVIQVGHRGGTPNRSKAYASYGYFNLRDYALADKKTAIEQLALKNPYIDVDRVGIYGHSGGGFMTAAALLQKPYNEFFKVGVSSSGNHDNNVYGAYWAERYHGLKEVEVKSGVAEKPKEVARADGTNAGDGTGNPDGIADPDEIPIMDGADDGLGIFPPGFLDEADDEKTKVDVAKEKVKEAVAAVKDAVKATKFEIAVPTNADLAANLKGPPAPGPRRHGQQRPPRRHDAAGRRPDQGQQALRHADPARQAARLRRLPALLHPADVGVLRRAPPRRRPDRRRHQREGVRRLRPLRPRRWADDRRRAARRGRGRRRRLPARRLAPGLRDEARPLVHLAAGPARRHARDARGRPSLR